jgi:hypothetical protein
MHLGSEVVTFAAIFSEETNPEQRETLHASLRECLLGTTTEDKFSLVFDRGRLLLNITNHLAILRAVFTWVTAEITTGTIAEFSVKNKRPRRRASSQAGSVTEAATADQDVLAGAAAESHDTLSGALVLPTNTFTLYLIDNGCEEGFITRYLNTLLRASLITHLPNGSIEFSRSFIVSLLNSTTYEEFSQNFTTQTGQPLQGFGATQFKFWKLHLSEVKRQPSILATYAGQVSPVINPTDHQPVLSATETVPVSVLSQGLEAMQYLGAENLLNKLLTTLKNSQYRYNRHMAIHSDHLPLEVLQFIKLHDFTRFHIAINLKPGASKVLTLQEYDDLKKVVSRVLDMLPKSS